MRLTMFICAMFAATAAQAWDPNEGAGMAPSTPQRAPSYSPPPMRWSQPAPPPARVSMPAPAPAPMAAPAPQAGLPPLQPIQYAPAASPAPSYQPAPSYSAAPSYAPPPAPAQVYSAPAVVPVAYTPPEPQTMREATWGAYSKAPDRIALGIEGFNDHYQEDSVELDNDALAGSITAEYTHFFDSRLFAGLEGRASYGEDDYSSISGQLEGIPFWEYEARGKFGQRSTLSEGATLDLYSGLGFRYYDYKFKGESVNGAAGYDRRIAQLYLPVGVTHTSDLGGWAFRKNIEADALLWGNVASRLGTIPGYGNVDNKQEALSGFGLRGELTFGYLNEYGSGFEIGPFARYWWVKDSKEKYDPVSTLTFIEPENSRLHLGATLRYLF